MGLFIQSFFLFQSALWPKWRQHDGWWHANNYDIHFCKHTTLCRRSDTAASDDTRLKVWRGTCLEHKCKSNVEAFKRKQLFTFEASYVSTWNSRWCPETLWNSSHVCWWSVTLSSSQASLCKILHCLLFGKIWTVHILHIYIVVLCFTQEQVSKQWSRYANWSVLWLQIKNLIILVYISFTLNIQAYQQIKAVHYNDSVIFF